MTLRRKYVNSTLQEKTCASCKKTYPLNENYFYRRKRKKEDWGYYNICITCDNEKNERLRKNNKSKKAKTQLKYVQSEVGYFQELFQGMRKSVNYVPSEFPTRYSVIEHWHKQKEIYGTKCPATGVEMTMIKGQNKKRTMTNISKDRILTWEGYTKINTIFTCWKYNCAKNSMTPKDAKAFLRIVKERYGTDEVE
jgi:hypothetical protein